MPDSGSTRRGLSQPSLATFTGHVSNNERGKGGGDPLLIKVLCWTLEKVFRSAWMHEGSQTRTAHCPGTRRVAGLPHGQIVHAVPHVV